MFNVFFRGDHVLFQGRPQQASDDLCFISVGCIDQTVVCLQQRTNRVISIALLKSPFPLKIGNSEVWEAHEKTRFVETIP